MLLCFWSPQILQHPLHESTSHCALCGHRHCKGRQKLIRKRKGPAPYKSVGIIMVYTKASERCTVGWMSVREAVRPRTFISGKFTPVNNKNSEKQGLQRVYRADGQNECHRDQEVVTATSSFLKCPELLLRAVQPRSPLSEVRANLGTSCNWNTIRSDGSAHFWSSIIHQHVTVTHPSQCSPRQSEMSASNAP